MLDSFLTLLRSEGLPEWGGWIYALLVVLVIIEGPIVTLLAAVAASAGYMRLPLVMVSALVGSAIADSFWYYLGYAHAEGRILRYARWLGLRAHHLEYLQEEMQQHASKLLFFAKFFSVMTTPTIIVAGMARVPLRRWFPIVFLVELIWVTGLTFIGFRAAAVARQVELGLHYLPLLGGLVLLVLVLVVSRRLKQRRPGGSRSISDAAADDTMADSRPYADGAAPTTTEIRPVVVAERSLGQAGERLPHLRRPAAGRQPVEE